MSNHPVAIVTGASRGIGRAMALNFAKQGYDVALISRNGTLLNKLSDEIKQNYSVNTGVFSLDVTDKEKIDQVIKYIIEAHGRIDVLFNNAGMLRVGTSEMNPEDFEIMYRTNVLGIFNFIHAIAPQMKQQRFGYIMNLSSFSGKRAVASSGGYAASKFAVTGFNEALFHEMLDYNVKVTALCPSVIDTKMTTDLKNFPNEKKIQISDIIETVNFLLKLGPTAIIKDIEILNPFLTKRSLVDYR